MDFTALYYSHSGQTIYKNLYGNQFKCEFWLQGYGFLSWNVCFYEMSSQRV